MDGPRGRHRAARHRLLALSRNPRDAAVAGLLLAAGGGSRLGIPKALVTVGGESLLDRAVGALRDAGCAPVLAVLGAAAAQVAPPAGVDVVVNPHWGTGMGSSLRAGLAVLERTDAAACVILLVDTPGIGAEAIRRVVAAARSGPDKDNSRPDKGDAGPDQGDAGPIDYAVAVAGYQGRRGHPVVIGRRHWPEVATLAEGDVGARPFLAAHPDLVRLVPCDDVARPDDLDTAKAVADYVRWRNGQ